MDFTLLYDDDGVVTGLGFEVDGVAYHLRAWTVPEPGVFVVVEEVVDTVLVEEV